MEEKRIYSLNLATYVALTTGILPVVKREGDNNLFYCVFPEDKRVGQAINEFRAPDVEVDLHRYLNCYHIIKDMIKLLKE